MQRIVTLAMFAALCGGGWMFLNGLNLGDVQRAVAGKGSLRGSAQDNADGTWMHRQPVHNLRSVNEQPPPPSRSRSIRIASYNIQVFGDTKSGKRPVVATLAHIVRHFDIVAIQEIRSQDDYLLARFVELINEGGKYHYDYVVGPRLGRTRSTEQYAFVYNLATVEIDRGSVYTVGDPDDLLHREPLVAMFRTRGAPPEDAFTFILVNIHTDPDETRLELDALADVYRVVRRASVEEDDVIVLGDFNVNDRGMGRLGRIPNMYPLIAGPNVTTNTQGTKLYDNIVIHRPSTVEFTGRRGVFDVIERFNLSMEQARELSDHFPVWGEFSVVESGVPSRFASRQSGFRPNSSRRRAR